MTPNFVDIHCHLSPGVDDGAADLAASMTMARMAVADGTRTIIATPHQLGGYAGNRGDEIRRRTAELQRELTAAGIALAVLPGGDVRIEDDLPARLRTGEALTLGEDMPVGRRPAPIPVRGWRRPFSRTKAA